MCFLPARRAALAERRRPTTGPTPGRQPSAESAAPSSACTTAKLATISEAQVAQ